VREAQDEEAGRDDAKRPAVIDDEPLLLLRDRPAAHFLQRVGRHRLHAEAHRAHARRVQAIEQLRIEPIEPRLALEPEIEAAPLDGVGDGHGPLTVLGEQRIPEDHIRTRVALAQVRELVGDVLHRAGAIAGQDAVRAIGAELGTSAARQHREAAAGRPPGARDIEAEPPLAQQIPAWKRQGIQVRKRRARDAARKRGAGYKLHHRGLGLAIDQEIGVRLEQLRHLRRREPDEPDARAPSAHHVGPGGLLLEVNQR